VTDLARFDELVPLDHGLMVVVTRRADQTPHATVVNAGVVPHPVTRDPVVALVAAGAPASSPTCAPTPPLPLSFEPAGSGPRSKAVRS
jgi:hypothetical protein